MTTDTELTSQIEIFMVATDDLCDPLLNPAHMLVGTQALDPELTTAFAEWIVNQNGQDVIRGLERNGEVLYTEAPLQEEIHTFETEGCTTLGTAGAARRMKQRRMRKV